MTAKMLLGPVMGDVEGLVLTPADRVRLMHPLMGGVGLPEVAREQARLAGVLAVTSPD